MTPFKKDVIDLFSRKRGGHVEHWLYSDTIRRQFSGSQLWQKFLKASSNYYVLQNETNLISTAAPALSSVLPTVQTLVDFGVGDADAVKGKIEPILRSLSSIKEYIGIDISQSFLDSAQQGVSNAFPNLDMRMVKADFFENVITLPKNNVLGVMLGATVSNMELSEGEAFPRKHIVHRLTHLKNSIGRGNHFLMSYDANNDPESIIAAYSNPFMGRLTSGIMFDVSPITQGNFLPDAWQHKLVWNEKAHVLHQCAEATRNMEFSIDEHPFAVAQGERFVTVNLFKFPAGLFQSMCDEAGFEVKESFSDHQHRMCLQLLRA